MPIGGGQISYLIDVCSILLCLQLLTPAHCSGKEGGEGGVGEQRVVLESFNGGPELRGAIPTP